ncbi:MAG: hypothetical protein ACYCSZ_14825 [Burkholderiales bacterium]
MRARIQMWGGFAAIFRGLVQHTRGDRNGWLVLAIKLMNAVLFTALWQAGLTVGWPLVLGLGFFAASMTLAFKLEKSRPSTQKH